MSHWKSSGLCRLIKDRLPSGASRLTRGLGVIGLTIATLSAGVAVLAAQSPQAPAAQEDFRPVRPGELEQEQIPAAPLVFVAYSVVWLALLAYVFVLWRRITTVERELRDVTSRLQAGQRK